MCKETKSDSFKFSKDKLYNVMQGNFDILYNAIRGNNTSHKWLGAVMLMSFIEYVLKYKIQKSGGEFHRIHAIHKLYRQLPCGEKETIKENFESIKSFANARGRNFSNSIESLLQQYNTEYTDLRYLVFRRRRTHR